MSLSDFRDVLQNEINRSEGFRQAKEFLDVFLDGESKVNTLKRQVAEATTELEELDARKKNLAQVVSAGQATAAQVTGQVEALQAQHRALISQVEGLTQGLDEARRQIQEVKAEHRATLARQVDALAVKQAEAEAAHQARVQDMETSAEARRRSLNAETTRLSAERDAVAGQIESQSAELTRINADIKAANEFLSRLHAAVTKGGGV